MATDSAATISVAGAAMRIHGMRLAKAVASAAGVCLAPFAFTWSGFCIFLALLAVAGMGITVGYHRLLAHNAFKTSRFARYCWAVLGCCSGQGGPLTWVATHRLHHGHADRERDPHSPTRGFWWAQLGWTFLYRPEFDDSVVRRRYVPDLERDPGLRVIERFEYVFPCALCVLLFCIGQRWGVGFSWAVWGSVFMTVLYHLTALVNSACHLWGYRTQPTPDRSTNFFWLILFSCYGENWHNNHHALPRSARFGQRWWEADSGYAVIRLLGALRLAWDIHVDDGGRYRVVRRLHPQGSPPDAPVSPPVGDQAPAGEFQLQP